MKCDDDKWHPCAYLSKGMTDVERNYDVHDKEMLGIMRALEAWRHYLEGCKHRFEIWTDHRNLEYFMSAKKLNRRQACWAIYLSRFDFKLIHKPGSSMTKADSLSRRPVIRLLLGCARKCTNPTVLSIKEYNVGPIKTHSIGTDGTTGYL